MEKEKVMTDEMKELLEDIQSQSMIPYIVYESEMTRQEKRQHRLVRVICLLILALVVMNLAWIHIWSDYDVKSYAAMSTRGNANVIGQDGDIYNGSGSDDAE